MLVETKQTKCCTIILTGNKKKIKLSLSLWHIVINSKEYLKSILQARQLVFLSKVCIWKLCWLAVALSGLMLDLKDNNNNKKSLLDLNFFFFIVREGAVLKFNAYVKMHLWWTYIAMSNCSIHFLFVSSVLQKNWKPCFPCRWIR